MKILRPEHSPEVDGVVPVFPVDPVHRVGQGVEISLLIEQGHRRGVVG